DRGSQDAGPREGRSKGMDLRCPYPERRRRPCARGVHSRRERPPLLDDALRKPRESRRGGDLMSTEPQTETPQEQQPQESLEMARLRQEKALTEFGGSPFASAAAAAHFQKIATIFSQSIFVPEVFRNKLATA